MTLAREIGETSYQSDRRRHRRLCRMIVALGSTEKIPRVSQIWRPRRWRSVDQAIASALVASA